jgi:Recombination directionality factor-like
VAIPGLKTKHEVRAKVRIGEKRSGYPASVDHFLSDDPELTNLFGAEPKTIRIRFPYQGADEAFSTGLEWWTKTKKNQNQLACYTKGEIEGGQSVALRLPPYVSPEDTVLGETKSGRVKIVCPNRECPFFKDSKCKPMGRLLFFLDGGRTDKVLELDTKSWNSIENLEPVLEAAGDLRGRVWNLSVAFESKGNKRFPVLSIEEADVQVNTEQDVEKADALVQLLAAVTEDGREDVVRRALASALDVTVSDWREQPRFIERIKEIGVEAAAIGLLKTNELWPE